MGKGSNLGSIWGRFIVKGALKFEQGVGCLRVIRKYQLSVGHPRVDGCDEVVVFVLFGSNDKCW